MLHFDAPLVHRVPSAVRVLPHVPSHQGALRTHAVLELVELSHALLREHREEPRVPRVGLVLGREERRVVALAPCWAIGVAMPRGRLDGVVTLTLSWNGSDQSIGSVGGPVPSLWVHRAGARGRVGWGRREEEPAIGLREPSRTRSALGHGGEGGRESATRGRVGEPRALHQEGASFGPLHHGSWGDAPRAYR